MPIEINGTGTITGISAGGYPDGTVTAADLASTLDLSGKTLTLPDVEGTIVQIQSDTNNTQVDTTSTSFISTGFGLSITPSSASSKILVLCLSSASPNSTGQGVYQKVVRGGSTDASNIVITYNDGSAADTWRSTFMFGVDSPNTTSSTQYMLYFRVHYSNSSGYSNWGGSAPQEMYLLELAQ